jgi:uncharacterized protein
MYIKRGMADKLKKLFKQYPIVTIIGPRQSGKTTLVKNEFPNLEYISLEDPDNREFALNDPRGFLDTYKSGVILDEVQRVPEVIPYLQTLVDLKNKAGQYVLTGSQNYLIHEKISQSLAGRTAILKLLPFSLEEIKGTKYFKDNYKHYLQKGFYPGIYEKELEPTNWYSFYVQTYIERDVRQIKNISDLNTFQKFIRLCAGRVGQILNLSSLANDVGISNNTVRSWLSILEMSFIIFLLQPYHNNFNKRLIKNSKLYFYDVGLVSYLLGIDNIKQIDTHYLKGSLFENYVISEILKYYYNLTKEPRCYFWRDKTGHEIDCLIESIDLMAIEIKAGSTISDHFFSNLDFFNKISSNSSKNSFVIYTGNTSQTRAKGSVLSWKEIGKLFI